MTNNRLAIIVLNWNGADDSIKCAESLINQTEKTDVILIDNNSSDNSEELLKKFAEKHNNIYFIKNNVNSGYTGGNNVGIRYAIDNGYEYVGSLNPDATADKNWAKYLIEDLDNDKSIGIATGILARSDKKTLDSTGDFYTIWGIPSPRNRNKPIENAPKSPEFIFGSTGGGFIARTDIFKKIGLFDENFFMYFEDVDLCFRAQLNGFKVWYNPKSIAYHKISASTNKVPGLAIEQTFKNLPMLFLKNVPFGLWYKIFPRFKLAYFLILVNSIVKGRGLYSLKGLAKYIKLIPHALKERHKIQKNRKVSNQYIDSLILQDIPQEQTGLRKFRDTLFLCKH